MVVTFGLELIDNTGLLEQVDFNITSGKLSAGTEVDTDELTL